ncbi:MAG: hypothetical protein ACFCUE_02020 [Candidatus Bathyarchaeia archaeon]|jgi:hypothetical protein
MKIALSGRVIGLILIIVLLATALNTYLVVRQYGMMNDAGQTDSSGYDFVVSQEDGLTFKARNTLTNQITYGFATASIAINYVLTHGSSVYLDKGTFNLTSDITVNNTWNVKIVGDGAVINGNGHKIVIHGDNYTACKYPYISGLIINNGTVRIENTFGATITNTIFQDSNVGLEFVNSDTWTEGTKIENCHFINCIEGIAFRKPIGTATGSYASSEINRCFFNQYDNSVAINVENQTEFSNSQLQDVRIWMGEEGSFNQTGLRLGGTMSQSLLIGVVFESFSNAPDQIFGIDILECADATPIIDGGVSFLGNWTSRIHNPHHVWISGAGSLFDRENMPVPVGLNGDFGDSVTIMPKPLKIATFKPKIDVQGSFSHNETITVRVQLEYLDNVYSPAVEKVFTNSSTVWLSDDELLKLFPSQNMVWAVIIDASCSSSSTDATVRVGGYGIAG